MSDRTFTGADLETLVRSRTDAVYDTSVTQAEILAWLSNWNAELRALLLASGIAFYEETQTLYGVADKESYDLNSDVATILRVDYIADTHDIRPLRPISVRDLHSVRRISSAEYSRFYRHVEDTLYLYKAPSANQKYEVRYIPTPPQITANTDEIDGLYGWEDFLVTGACTDLLSKQDRLEALRAQEKRLDRLRGRIEKQAIDRAQAEGRSLVERSGPMGYQDYSNLEDDILFWWGQ